MFFYRNKQEITVALPRIGRERIKSAPNVADNAT